MNLKSPVLINTVSSLCHNSLTTLPFVEIKSISVSPQLSILGSALISHCLSHCGSKMKAVDDLRRRMSDSILSWRRGFCKLNLEASHWHRLQILGWQFHSSGRIFLALVNFCSDYFFGSYFGHHSLMHYLLVEPGENREIVELLDELCFCKTSQRGTFFFFFFFGKSDQQEELFKVLGCLLYFSHC